ncbi:unnamed protein product [Paramecium pentaurelia]|uniref:Uncharacterized protein n=1 Tax=Paramecium pentaurelia TaxID=43138 RepID=A0A8S1W1G8_9CILI|nr:unnamed protein product [Paramecium pentaurelia]
MNLYIVNQRTVRIKQLEKVLEYLLYLIYNTTHLMLFNQKEEKIACQKNNNYAFNNNNKIKKSQTIRLKQSKEEFNEFKNLFQIQ